MNFHNLKKYNDQILSSNNKNQSLKKVSFSGLQNDDNSSSNIKTKIKDLFISIISCSCSRKRSNSDSDFYNFSDYYTTV